MNHGEGEYVRYVKGQRPITSNAVEAFFSQLKRSLDGTYHHVSRKHLHRYLAEFDFRHTTRSERDGQRFTCLPSQVAGVRLSYRPLSA